VCEPDFRVEPFAKSQHDREGFTCSINALEYYLHNQANQDAKKGVAAVFVLTPDGRTIAGYYTLSQFSIRLHDIPPETARRLTRYPEVPATLLGRLAVSDEYRGRGLGEKLLLDALQRCLHHSRQIASLAVVVDAKNDEARRFYLRYGFLDLPGVPNRLFIPMGTIEQLPLREGTK
jgi:GNAT superfamily N-acetyltransferase